MSSATSNRQIASVTGPARANRFGDFSATSGRHNSDDRSAQTSTLGQAYSNGSTWQPSSGIWGTNPIGGGFTSTKRDASASRGRPGLTDESRAVTDAGTTTGKDNFTDGPSGSGALAASSEADTWGTRTNGPWNTPRDSTSPPQPSHNGNTPPSLSRANIPTGGSQSLLEIQNPYTGSRQAIGQGVVFSRPPPKSSSLDPSSGSFKFSQKPAFGYEDKENSGQFTSNGEKSFDIDSSSRSFRIDQLTPQNGGFLGVGGSASRDGSMPPSRASDAGLSQNGLSFGNGNPPFGSISHTPRSSIHSQRASFSGLPGSMSSQANGSRFMDTSQAEAEMREKFSGLAFTTDGEPLNGPQSNNYSPGPPAYTQTYQPSGSNMWSDASNSKSLQHFDGHPSHAFADPSYLGKGHRFTERGSVSPAGSEHRGLNSPKYYSAAATPPTGSEQIYRPGSRGPRAPPGPIELDRRLQGVHFAQYVYNTPFQAQFPPQSYDYVPQNFRQGTVPYGFAMPIPPYSQTQSIPTRPARDHDVGVGVRSLLLEEFRSNSKSNKRYELKDIYNHVVEFSGDQHGSRFIQQKLETANSDEKEQLFREIQPNALQLMTDVFGNYVIQKLFEHGNQVQKRVLAEQMKNHVMELSMQMYGCRVVQKALEHVLADQQAQLVEELQADVLKCVKDQNGNHVVQKAIERVPAEHIRFVIDAFRGQVHTLAAHPYGCRVIQRILEYCKPQDQAAVLEELHQCATMLITDQYGNYVTQHIIQHGKPEDRAKIIKIVTGNLLTLSKHKFASNVVEKSIQFGSDEQRKAIVAQLTALHSDGSSPLQLMMKDQYGNYVIQKLLAQLKGAEREAFVEDMKPQLVSLKRFNYGKQIAAIEKLIFNGPPPYASAPSINAPTAQTMPIEINSSAATPMLTNGQNSPQSSSLPSTNVSTIEEPAENASACKTIAEINEKAAPEVVLNSI